MTKSLYFSPTGTTAAVCKAIAGVAGYDITTPAARETLPDFWEDDLVVVGAPVYGGRLPPIAADCIARLSGKGAKAAAVVVYGNRDFDDALLELADLLEKAGFAVVAAAAFIGEHSLNETVAKGRPNGDDIALAGMFGTVLREKLAAGDVTRPEIPGNRPYMPIGRFEPYAPQPTDACTHCGKCDGLCPTGAIKGAVANEALCIRCCACLKGCPVAARAFTNPKYEGTRAWLAEKCARPRLPKWFS